jgi:molecular chaperone GrpE (heat shock protein)
MPLDRHTFLSLMLAQQFPHDEKEPPPKRMPDGTLQSEAILKEEHKRMLADVDRIQELAQEVEDELKKFGHHVLSTGLLKKLDEIEKLARRMRGRHNR